jgi:hypothetical protein
MEATADQATLGNMKQPELQRGHYSYRHGPTLLVQGSGNVRYPNFLLALTRALSASVANVQAEETSTKAIDDSIRPKRSKSDS